MSDKFQFILKPLNNEYPLILIKESVLTVGRSETCDYPLNNQFLSFVHATLTKRGDLLVVTDLDSTNGVFVNDEKISSEQLKAGDILRFGSVRYEVEYREVKTEYQSLGEATKTHALLNNESVLKALSEVSNDLPQEAPAVVSKGTIDIQESTSLIQVDNLEELKTEPVNENEQTIVGLFPEFEFTEFIFEQDVEGNAFDFNNREACLEVTSLFGNCIHDIDYFKVSDKDLVFTSKAEQESKLTLPIIGLTSDLKIAESQQDGKFRLLKTDFFSYKIFGASGLKENCFLNEDSYELQKDDLVIISNENLNIYLKQTDSPPTTKKVGFRDKDKLLSLLFLFFSFLWLLIIAFMLFVFEPSEKPKDPDEISKKIDRILYKKKPPTVVKPDIKEEADIENPIVEKVKKPTEEPENEPDPKKAEGEPVDEVAEEPTVVDSKDKPKERIVAPSPPAPAPEPVEKPEPIKAKKITKKIVKTSLKAKKTIPPAVKIKSLTSKYSQALGDLTSNTSGSKNSKKLRKSITQTNSSTGQKDISFMKNKQRKSDVLSGTKIGDFGVGQITTGSNGKVFGLKGQSGKRTVVLGMLDPRDIQNVLRKHLPRFGYCYDRELERKNKRFSTTIDLKFTIHANGRAKSPSFTSKSMTFSSSAISCLRQVMSTIQFPRPKGGGIVKVRQPINLEPK